MQPQRSRLKFHVSRGRFHDSFNEIHRRIADESGDERIAGFTIHVIGRADLFDRPLIHDHDFFTQRHGFDLIVRHVHHGHVQPLMQLLQFHAHGGAEPRVQVGQRFVKKKQSRFADNGPADGHALTLPAGQFLRFSVEQRLNVQQFGGFGYSRFNDGRRFFAHLQPEGQVFSDRQVWIQRVMLKHHGHISIPWTEAIDDLRSNRD